MKKYTLASFKKQLKRFQADHIYDHKKEWIVKSLEFQDFHNYGIKNGYLKFEQYENDIYKTFFLTDRGFEVVKKLRF